MNKQPSANREALARLRQSLKRTEAELSQCEYKLKKLRATKNHWGNTTRRVGGYSQLMLFDEDLRRIFEKGGRHFIFVESKPMEIYQRATFKNDGYTIVRIKGLQSRNSYRRRVPIQRNRSNRNGRVNNIARSIGS
jgi:hypothetical protein